MSRDQNKDGRYRKKREDTTLGNVDPKLQKDLGYNKAKTLGKACEDHDVTSLTKLREKSKKK